MYVFAGGQLRSRRPRAVIITRGYKSKKQQPRGSLFPALPFLIGHFEDAFRGCFPSRRREHQDGTESVVSKFAGRRNRFYGLRRREALIG